MDDIKKPDRKRLRLKGYDYSKNGSYFITVCTEKRRELFWDKNGNLNQQGEMVCEMLQKTEERFGHLVHAWAVMPNHIHAIIDITCNEHKEDDKIIQNKGIKEIMHWFKTITTNCYYKGVKEKAWPLIQGKLWQKSYYDHIIRSERSSDRIEEYIMTNPEKWEQDAENSGAGKDKKKYYDELTDPA